MLKYQIVEKRMKEFNAFVKAPADINNISLSCGFHPLYISILQGDSLLCKIIRKVLIVVRCIALFLTIKKGSVLLIQTPCLFLITSPGLTFLRSLKAVKGVKIINLIHDADEFRFGGNAENQGRCSIKPIVLMSNNLIVHNAKMGAWYAAMGVETSKIVTLDIFDYLTSCNYVEYEWCENSWTLIIAGTLNPDVVGFVKYLKEHQSIQWELYGPRFNYELTAAVNVHYNGCFNSEELPSKLKGGFGLIWYGDSQETCTGYLRDYIRIINPHKLSLYLASGIPVIVWSESAVADFVRKNGVGLCINSLYDLERILHTISKAQYLEMKLKVKALGYKLRAGYHTRKALELCLNKLSYK